MILACSPARSRASSSVLRTAIGVRTVAEHLEGDTSLELVQFVLFSEETYGLFADALEAAG